MKIDLDASLDRLTEKIIGSAFAVANTLGHGFLEVVYKHALIEELSASGLEARKEVPFPVLYRGTQVGLYVADVVVEGTVIVELKAIEKLTQSNRAQLLNYLKASGLPVGLLLNFGTPHIEVKRVVL
ncbi:GxxExxY protein [Magnetospirillum sp. UT-4]|uniref:GxxExxY protein n=1 Tax=Magnetospirillum sp. UT-4 TaxID=2681467 RepID=UPI00138175B9|nr:GxxExxY protein [Magnetospirillum sp. UT-4]CAA7624303.1 conserved hypothetical protein [Magnetospirillum sp. UT-4]